MSPRTPSLRTLVGRLRVVAAATAVALVAVACGSDAESTTPTLAVAVDSSEPAEPDSLTDDTTAEPAPAPDATDDVPTDEEAAPDGPVENLFPDIDVADIADGSTVNLAAELGGGDKPTLLWFFAPH